MNNIFGGNNAGGITNTSNVTVNSGNISNIYGGGNSTNSGITYVNINGGTITGDVFGGSNLVGTVQESNVTINNGNINNVYGGNNQGGTTLTPKVRIEGGETTNVYGGGNMAVVPQTDVELNAGIVDNIYRWWKSSTSN